MGFELYKRLWKQYIMPYKKAFFLSIALSLVVSGLTAAIAWLIKPALDKIFIDKDRTMLLLIPAGVIALNLVKGIFTYLQSYMMAYLGQNIITDIRNDVYKKILYLPIPTYNRLTSGTLSARIFYDVNVLQSIVSGSIKNTVQQVFTIVALTGVIFYRDWKLAGIAVTVLPFTALFMQKMGKRVKALAAQQNNVTGNIFGCLNETLGSPRIIKAFRAEEKEAGNFRKITDEMKVLVLKLARVRSISSPLMEFLGSLGVAGIILYGGWQVISGTTTPGSFFSFMGALFMLYAPIKTLSATSNGYNLAIVSAERIFEVLDMPDEAEGLYGPGRKRLEGVKGSVVYDRVCFSYEGAPENTLRDVNLEIKAGEVVAFVGESGAGKTTAVNLLPRFYDVTDGSIRIDGVDIRDYGLASLRDNISIVTQDVMLFNETIKYNIAYGSGDAPDEDIVKAAKAAYAHEFIQTLPKGYDSKVGEKAGKLSGGEKQRIAIARAILKDAPILILDEATSSLDSRSEHMVQKALDNLMKDRTTLVIAHRLSTVRNADRIVVVEDGRIAETGTHRELMALGGYYRKLHDMQYFSEESAEEMATAVKEV